MIVLSEPGSEKEGKMIWISYMKPRHLPEGSYAFLIEFVDT